MIDYLPYEERTPDTQYRDVLAKIVDRGRRAQSAMGDFSRRLFVEVLRYDFRNGLPILTERDLVTPNEKMGRSYYSMALGELFAFLHGARTLEEMRKWGCPWWAPWVSAEKCAKRGLESGDLGPGSYGPAWCAFPTAEGESFDQVAHLEEQIRELPHLRTHLLTPFIPQYLGRGEGKIQKVVVVPCHGLVFVFIDTFTNELTLAHVQRSADMLVGVPANLIEYSHLTLMLAQTFGYKVSEYIHVLVDAHIYEMQLPYVEKFLAIEPQRLPTVKLDPEIRGVRNFRHEHFEVSDYHPQLPMERIPTPV